MTALYDRIGQGYATRRKPDARIYRLLRNRFEGCGSIVNVGAGAGSYEPEDLPVIAVEPSYQMIAQRVNRANVVQATAEALPLRDKSADGVMGALTLHHWADKQEGLRECARVARKHVCLLTWDPASDGFWLVQEYFPELLAYDRTVFPALTEIQSALETWGRVSITPVLIPADCVDGFLGAYWQKPSAYLNPTVRACVSSFSRIPDVRPGLEALQRDITTGAWQHRHGQLLSESVLDIGYRLVSAAL